MVPPTKRQIERALDGARDINADVLRRHDDTPNPERAASALWAIPADTGREEWLPVVFAARAAGVSQEVFLDWCRTGGDKYTTDDDSLKAWNSFDPNRPKGIGAGTLFHLARQHGWQDPAHAAVLAQPAGSDAASTATAAATATAIADELARPTDLWLAREFAKQCGTGFRHDHSAKLWRHYRGGSWTLCGKGEHIEAMKRLAGWLMQQAGLAKAADSDSERGKKLMACALRAQSAQGIEAALKLAQSDPALAVRADELDRDPDLLNVANGVIHLPSATLRPHDPTQMLCRQSPVAHDPAAACPQFIAFMDEVSCNDPGWVEFMQRALGYCLSGHVSEEKLLFWLGTGANGKSVLANIVRFILGTYSATVPPAFMMQNRRDGGSATPELAMLAGVRTALANEIESGSKLSAQTVKVAVSTEHITARALYGAPFTFAPTHKLLIRGNHRPIVTDDDDGIWRRILLVPFDLNVPDHARDPGLEARLLTEAPGILRWMVDGFAQWQRAGLNPPKRVSDASLAYRRESDLLTQWVNEHCDVGPAFTVEQRTAYGNYRMWCHDQGLRQFSKASFTRGLIERGFGEGRQGGGARQHLYTGLQIRNV
jgi:putative DNA primase/helicase